MKKKGFLIPLIAIVAAAALALGALYLSSKTTSTIKIGDRVPVSSGGTVTSIITSAPLTGGTITGSGTIGIPAATSLASGYLSSTDWSTFNGKGAGSVTSITASTPLTGGAITTSGSIGCQAASGSQAGCLSNTDWTTFNNKGSGTVTAVSVATANGVSGSSSGGATPALTLSLGAITPSSVVTSGTGAVTAGGFAKGGGFTNTDGATITVDWSKGNTQEITLGATGRTLAFTNVPTYGKLVLWVWQDATGSRTITTYPAGVRWAGGTAPTLTATASKFDLLVFTTASSNSVISGGASTNY